MEKETVGKQVIEKHGKSEAPDCREVTNASWAKTFQPRLRREIETYKGDADPVYIMLSMKNEGLLGPTVKHATWVLFEENPPPKESAVLWSYRKSDGELRIEWVLPDEASIEEICDMPETYDPKLVADCKNFMATKRIAVDLTNKPRPKANKIILPG